MVGVKITTLSWKGRLAAGWPRSRTLREQPSRHYRLPRQRLVDTRGTRSTLASGRLPVSAPRRGLLRTSGTYEHPLPRHRSRPVHHARPFSGLANCDEVAPHPRLLPPRLVARFMGGQDDA